jgi:hypothetical protein
MTKIMRKELKEANKKANELIKTANKIYNDPNVSEEFKKEVSDKIKISSINNLKKLLDFNQKLILVTEELLNDAQKEGNEKLIKKINSLIDYLRHEQALIYNDILKRGGKI